MLACHFALLRIRSYTAILAWHVIKGHASALMWNRVYKPVTTSTQRHCAPTSPYGYIYVDVSQGKWKVTPTDLPWITSSICVYTQSWFLLTDILLLLIMEQSVSTEYKDQHIAYVLTSLSYQVRFWRRVILGCKTKRFPFHFNYEYVSFYKTPFPRKYPTIVNNIDTDILV